MAGGMGEFAQITSCPNPNTLFFENVYPPVLLSIRSYAAGELASDGESRLVLTKYLPTILHGDSRSFYAEIFKHYSSFMTCNFFLKLNKYIV